MNINNFDVQIKHGAANLADTGLRYVGFSGLFVLGLMVSAIIDVNNRLGRGLSWLQCKLKEKGKSLLDGISGRKTDQEQDVEGLEVPQERKVHSSESEHQADSDGKQMEGRSTPDTIDDKIDFDQVTSEVSPMPVATDEEKPKEATAYVQ